MLKIVFCHHLSEYSCKECLSFIICVQWIFIMKKFYLFIWHVIHAYCRPFNKGQLFYPSEMVFDKS